MVVTKRSMNVSIFPKVSAQSTAPIATIRKDSGLGTIRKVGNSSRIAFKTRSSSFCSRRLDLGALTDTLADPLEECVHLVRVLLELLLLARHLRMDLTPRHVIRLLHLREAGVVRCLRLNDAVLGLGIYRSCELLVLDQRRRDD